MPGYKTNYTNLTMLKSYRISTIISQNYVRKKKDGQLSHLPKYLEIK